ncbi:Zinc finger, ZZ-type [Sesbania bispinosa]|nr:Zinc finger, ZZ-type [Sesbania bispinosa]
MGLSLTIIIHSSLVLEEEKKSGFYSPQLDPDTCESQAKFGHSCSPSSSPIKGLLSNSCNVGTSECMEQSGCSAHEGDENIIYFEHTSDGEHEVIGTPVEGKNMPQEELYLQPKISAAEDIPYFYSGSLTIILHSSLVLEEEKKSGFYSPQRDPDNCESQVKFDHSGIPSSPIKKISECMEQSWSSAHEGDESIIYCEHSSDGEPEVIETPVEGKKKPQEEPYLEQKMSAADVLCTMCKQLLFHPVVLNCGHVYCETCIFKLADEMLRCQVCQSPHPRGFPKVCLEFDHFLEEQFPEEYARRRDALELKQIKVKPETPSCCSLDNGNKGENMEWWSDPDSKVHIGVGCDFCGMFPIIGDRYKCNDCKEKMGFDLCGECYDTRSKLPGRFNQQHTSEHKFKLVQPNIIRNIMLRLVTGQLGDSSIDTESFGNLEFTSDASALFDDGEDNNNQNDSEATN